MPVVSYHGSLGEKFFSPKRSGNNSRCGLKKKIKIKKKVKKKKESVMNVFGMLVEIERCEIKPLFEEMETEFKKSRHTK